MRFGLPKEITTSDGKVYGITESGDYRMVLDCFSALNDEELSEDERVLASFLIFYNDFTEVEDIQDMDKETYAELVKEMFSFFNLGEPENPNGSHKKLIDWDKDASIISAGVNNVAKTEIRALEYLHWWTFMGYYMSIGESVLSTVVGIREKISKGKKLEKHEQEFRKNNPNYFVLDTRTVAQKEADSFIRQLWNNGE